MELKLESRALKASVVLDPAALAGVEVPNGLSKVTLRVAVPGKTIVAEVNAKSLRRTVAAIAAAGPNGVAVVLQGKLEPATCSPRPASQPSRRRRSQRRRTDDARPRRLFDPEVRAGTSRSRYAEGVAVGDGSLAVVRSRL